MCFDVLVSKLLPSRDVLASPSTRNPLGSAAFLTPLGPWQRRVYGASALLALQARWLVQLAARARFLEHSCVHSMLRKGPSQARGSQLCSGHCA